MAFKKLNLTDAQRASIKQIISNSRTQNKDQCRPCASSARRSAR